MKLRVMISAPYMIPVVEQYRSRFESAGIELIVPTVHERLEEADLLPIVSDIDGVICGDDRFTARVFEAAPRLKVISKWGTGIDSIDQEAARAKGVRVCNTPNAFTHPVSDTVLGYVLSFARQLPWMDQEMKNGLWSKRPSVSLMECCIGVVGVGNIGQAVLRKAAAFGMRLLGTDLVAPPAEFIRQTNVSMMPLEDLLNQADFVSLNCSLTPQAVHLMNAARFSLMKRTAVIINTSRGPVIEETALVSALQGGRIAGAALDVFEEEPLPKNSPLRAFPNVLLASHNSNSSPTAWKNVHENTIANLLNVLRESGVRV